MKNSLIATSFVVAVAALGTSAHAQCYSCDMAARGGMMAKHQLDVIKSVDTFNNNLLNQMRISQELDAYRMRAQEASRQSLTLRDSASYHRDMMHDAQETAEYHDIVRWVKTPTADKESVPEIEDEARKAREAREEYQQHRAALADEETGTTSSESGASDSLGSSSSPVPSSTDDESYAVSKSDDTPHGQPSPTTTVEPESHDHYVPQVSPTTPNFDGGHSSTLDLSFLWGFGLPLYYVAKACLTKSV